MKNKKNLITNYSHSKNERNALLKLIFKYTQIAKEELRILAFRILVDIAKYFYDCLYLDIEDFVNLTKIHVSPSNNF